MCVWVCVWGVLYGVCVCVCILRECVYVCVFNYAWRVSERRAICICMEDRSHRVYINVYQSNKWRTDEGCWESFFFSLLFNRRSTTSSRPTLRIKVKKQKRRSICGHPVYVSTLSSVFFSLILLQYFFKTVSYNVRRMDLAGIWSKERDTTKKFLRRTLYLFLTHTECWIVLH